MEKAVIRMQDVTKKRGQRLVGPLSLDIPKGYITGIMGSNSAGKSTLIYMLMQMAHADSGRIELMGQQLQGEHLWELKQQIGFVPETSWSDYGGETLQSEMKFRKHWYPNWNDKLCDRLVDLFEIDPKQPFAKMSKGMRRKCDLLLAMVHEPELLILDEPSSGLDPLAWKAMLAELQSFMDKGERTILFASHIVEEVKRLADYIVFMHKGKFLGIYEKDALFDQCKVMWLDAAASFTELERMPGVVAVERGSAQRIQLVTLEAGQTEQTLMERNIPVLRIQEMELDDILSYFIQREMNN